MNEERGGNIETNIREKTKIKKTKFKERRIKDNGLNWKQIRKEVKQGNDAKNNEDCNFNQNYWGGCNVQSVFVSS